MNETPKHTKASAGSNDGDFFNVGPPLHPARGGYVRRPADDALYAAITEGRYAHVMAPARSGKSSLIAATAARLRNHGYKVAVLDLAQIAERDGGSDAGRWYYSIAYRLLRQCRLKVDLQAWWQDKAILSNRQRLVEFYIEIVLQNIQESVVIFVDEIQKLENLPFKEHLLPSIRAAHNARVTDPDFQRLSFVMLGECDAQSLESDPSVSPFSVSQEILLDDFIRTDIDLFVTELNLPGLQARTALDRIWYWTNGHPYLTQKLCRAIARDTVSGDVEEHVDRIVHQQLAGRAALHNEPHMNHIHRRIVDDRRDFEALLNLYGRLRKGLEVVYEPTSRPQRKLLASGLVVVTDDGALAVRNRLYKAVFTARWANNHLPLRWRGPALVTALIVVLIAVPFWYTQLLPKPYMRVLVSPTLPLESVADAWRNLRSFPGHVETADRLYLTLLKSRASATTQRSDIQQIEKYARALPDNDIVADELVAKFWDREANREIRNEQRDAALLASIEALTVSTPQRRRLAAALLGDDYPHLVASLSGMDADRFYFDAGDMLLSYITGASVSQWSLQNRQLVAREPWVISSLEVTPLVRRVVVDRSATVSRIGLVVNISHARLDDIRLKLIAPSGRTVELEFDADSSSANDETVFRAESLAALIGESVMGTWSLTVRDEATEVSGHLLGWNLNLNSQVIVESFDRGLDIPAPLERESDNIWFSSDGRYAVARALHSDSARMWDLRSTRPARAISVPADERVIGLSADASYLVTVAQNNLHLWRMINGRREAVIEAGVGGAQVELTADGKNVFVVRRGEPETEFRLWSLQSRQPIASLHIAGSPALVTVDREGERIAVADYDRAVRVWKFRSGEQLAQLDLHAQASEIRLSADGSSLAIVHGEQGISLWQVDAAAAPMLIERGVDRWQMRFSPSGSRLIAGSPRRGYQLFRSSDGSMIGPVLDAGVSPGSEPVLAFSLDEDLLLTAGSKGRARFWQFPVVPQVAEVPGPDGDSASHRLWRDSGDSPAAVSPGGRYLAIADRDGHVHVLSSNASAEEIANASDELNYLGHQGAVLRIAFSRDGLLVASAGEDGAVRVWDVVTGLPRPYRTNAAAGGVRDIIFSNSGSKLAVLSDRRVAVIDVADGALLADLDLGELHTSIAFSNDDEIYIGAERGTLRSLTRDRVGNWTLRNVWTGTQPLRRIGASAKRPLLVIVDASNRAVLLNLQNGQVGESSLQLPNRVTDVLFSPSNTRVLLKTTRWVHRALVSTSGLTWRGAARTPNTITGSEVVVDRLEGNAGDPMTLDPLGDRVLLLTRDAGFAEIAEVSLVYDSGPLLFGSREDLLQEWQQKLGYTGP